MSKTKRNKAMDPSPRRLAANDFEGHWLHWLTKEQDQRLIVAVLRDDMGVVFSQIASFPFRRGTFCVGYDRQTKGRSPLNDEQTIICRAKLVAFGLGLDYLEDLRWPCRANSGLRCYCPECQRPPNIETRPRGQEW